MLERQRERERLNQALNTLPERDQAVMQLYCDEWSYKQIAEMTGFTEKKVDNIIHRSKKKLQVSFKK